MPRHSLDQRTQRNIDTMASAAAVPPGIHIRYEDNIAIMWLNNGENRLNQNSVRDMSAVLDQVESNESIKALIITGVGKYFSCGLDLDWLSNQDNDTSTAFFADCDKFISRLLIFPMLTVAAINGHCYAAGGFMAMACDYRIMRTQRGWVCFPEINIKIPIQPPTVEMLRVKIRDNLVFRDMVMYGQRLTGEEAKDKGVVDDCVDMKDLMQTALNFSRLRIGADGFDRTIVHQMKQNLYGIVCDTARRIMANVTESKMSGQEKLARIQKSRL